MAEAWEPEADDCVVAFDDPCARAASYAAWGDAVALTRAKMRAVVTWVATVEFRRPLRRAAQAGDGFSIQALIDVLTAIFFRIYRVPMCAAGAEQGLQVLTGNEPLVGEMIARMRTLLDVVHAPRCDEAAELATDGDWEAWWLGTTTPTVDDGR